MLLQGRNPPRNCSQAFTKDGDQVYTNRSYASDQRRPNFLSGDVEEEIRCVCVCLTENTDLRSHVSICLLSVSSLCLCFLPAPLSVFHPTLLSPSLLPPPPCATTRHLQGEIQNQSAYMVRFRQQIKKVEDDVRQNEGLLRKAHEERKRTKVSSPL